VWKKLGKELPMKEFKKLVMGWLVGVTCDIASRPKPNIGDNDVNPQYLWECGIKQGKKEAYEEILAQWPGEKQGGVESVDYNST
jgi:hypothetical protein